MLLAGLLGCSAAVDDDIDAAVRAGADVYAPQLLREAREAAARGESGLAHKRAEEAIERAQLLQQRAKDAVPNAVVVDAPQPVVVARTSTEEAAALVQAGALLLDVRTPSVDEKVPGALAAPRSTLKDALYPHALTLLLIGTGHDEAAAAAVLAARGYDHVFVVDGGVDAWKQRVLGSARGPAPCAVAELQALRDAGAVVVDARAADAYVAGHISGARSVPEPELKAAAFGDHVVVVVGIDDADSLRAARVAYDANKNVRWLQGGFTGYANDGGLIEAGAPSRTPSTTEVTR